MSILGTIFSGGAKELVEEIFFPLIERVERLLEAPESTLKKE